MPFHYILPEDPPTFPIFVRAVIHHWGVLMSGGIITFFIGVFQRFSGADIPYPVYIGVLILFVFIACYLAWIDARQEMHRLSLEVAKKEQELLNKDEVISDKNHTITELRQELSEVKERRTPELKTDVIQAACGQYIQADNKKFTALTFVVEVTNLGVMPSVVKDWKLEVFVPGNVFRCLPPPFPKFTLEVDGALNTVLKENDYLANKTFTPITSGAMTRGFLVFFVPLPPALVNVKGTKTILHFQDSTGKDYEIINDTFPYASTSGFVKHIPGMEIEIEKPKKKVNKKPRWKK
jgi:hypothetical protein